MSEDRELPADQALAAEHALGVLGARDRAAAEARMAAEPAFAAEVEIWRDRLAPLAEEVAPVAAPADLWARIERALPANDNLALTRRLRFWRSAAAGAFALAAASVTVAVLSAGRPPVTILQPKAEGPLLNASLNNEAGPMFVAAYDPDRRAMIITCLIPPGAVDPQREFELWLVPSDGKPRSLGMVEPGASHRMPMAESLAPMVSEGAMLVVSVEPAGGSAGQGPSGPIKAKGMLNKI